MLRSLYTDTHTGFARRRGFARILIPALMLMFVAVQLLASTHRHEIDDDHRDDTTYGQCHFCLIAKQDCDPTLPASVTFSTGNYKHVQTACTNQTVFSTALSTHGARAPPRS